MITQNQKAEKTPKGASKGVRHEFAEPILLRLDAIRAREGLGSYVLGVCGCQANATDCALASSLATSAVQMNMGRVLLVSSNSAQQTLWNRSQGGLIDLINENASAGDVIRDSDVEDLHILPSGQPGRDALVPDQVHGALKGLRHDYDLIVLELPPVDDSTQSLLFSRCVDGVALVIDGKKTRARAAKAALRILEENDVKVLGTIMKRVSRTLPRFLEWF